MDLNYRQLIFAREYRGFSQTELANEISGLSQSNLSKFEKGVSTLSEETVKKIIDYLNFPESWLSQNISNLPESAHYRKRASITKSIKTDIEFSNRVVGYIVDQMSDSIEWPEFKLKPLDIEEGYSPEHIAKYARKSLGINPNDPIKNVFSLLESNGIIIVEVDSYEKFDGVSFITDNGNPLIIINKGFSSDRKRYTLAHELGHLLIHHFPIPEHRDVEKIKESEADRFASEFLMPADAIRNSLKNLKLSYLAELKKYWLTSMASIIRRAKDLGCIDYEKYQYLVIELSRTGKRKNEDIDVAIDEARLFIEAYRIHKNELNYSDSELAAAFYLPVDVIERFCKPNKLRVIL